MSKRPAAQPTACWPASAAERPDPAALRSVLERHGGFTIDGSGGHAIDDGVAVCIDPAAAFVFHLDEWNDDAVAGWLERNGRDLGEGEFLGGWLDGHLRCWLDVVRVFRSDLVDGAIELGRALEQRAAFDLGRRTVIHLNGPPVVAIGST